MPEFNTRKRVAFSARQMYELVADVERYPEFLPLCEGLEIKSRQVSRDGELLIAEMRVGYGAVKERFTSRVQLMPAGPTVRADYVDGPFRHLENRWTFRDVTDGCDVDFFISYEFKSAILGMLVGSVFDHAFRKFTTAFEERAYRVYGSPAKQRQ
jgi:coenzyme Q-binding protein COQ10